MKTKISWTLFSHIYLIFNLHCIWLSLITNNSIQNKKKVLTRYRHISHDFILGKRNLKIMSLSKIQENKLHHRDFLLKMVQLNDHTLLRMSFTDSKVRNQFTCLSGGSTLSLGDRYQAHGNTIRQKNLFLQSIPWISFLNHSWSCFVNKMD